MTECYMCGTSKDLGGAQIFGPPVRGKTKHIKICRGCWPAFLEILDGRRLALASFDNIDGGSDSSTSTTEGETDEGQNET